MSFNKSPLAFDDVRKIFDAALEAPKGVKIKLPSPAAAIHMRARMHHFRSKIDRQNNYDIYPPEHPMHGNSVYDRLVVKLNKGEDTLVVMLGANTVNIEEIK